MSILRIIKLYIFLYFPYLVFNQTLGPLCRKLNEDFAHFSLNLLYNAADYSYEYTEDNRSYRIYFNFCALTTKQCRGSSSYGILFSLDSAGNDLNETCKHLTSTNININSEYNLNNPDDASSGIKLTLKGGERFDSVNNYEMTFRIYCAKNTLSIPFLLDEIYSDRYQYQIQGRSAAGCPHVSNNVVYQFILDNNYVLGIIFLIIGFIECFLGLAIIKETIFLVGFFSGFGFLMMVFGEFFMTPDIGIFYSWILLLIAIILGGINGFISTTVPKLGFIGLGFWLGFIFAFIINNLFLFKVEINPAGLLLYIIMGMLGSCFGLLSMCIWRHIVILATSFLGAYLVIRSLSIMIGYYPNELTLDKQISYKEVDAVGYEFYIYFIFLFILTTFGMILQFRNKRKIGGRFAGIYYEKEFEEEKNRKLKEILHKKNMNNNVNINAFSNKDLDNVEPLKKSNTPKSTTPRKSPRIELSVRKDRDEARDDSNNNHEKKKKKKHRKKHRKYSDNEENESKNKSNIDVEDDF